MILKQKGVTLFEMLLVLIIITSIILMMTNYSTTKLDESKRDRAVAQMEQILNAGLAYYINYSKWPDSIEELQDNNYLSKKGDLLNPFASPYYVSHDTNNKSTFQVCTSFANSSNGPIEASIVAGRLPLAYTNNNAPPMDPAPECPADESTCSDPDACDNTTVVSSVTIPGQNLNNARSINFAGIYRHGACVPTPICPDGMEPTIFVAPLSVSGQAYWNKTPPTGLSPESVFPIESFTAYSVGFKPIQELDGCGGATTPGCYFDTDTEINDDLQSDSEDKTYWRVCAEVITEEGPVSFEDDPGKESPAILMAVTRCVPKDEPTGSGFCINDCPR